MDGVVKRVDKYWGFSGCSVGKAACEKHTAVKDDRNMDKIDRLDFISGQQKNNLASYPFSGLCNIAILVCIGNLCYPEFYFPLLL